MIYKSIPNFLKADSLSNICLAIGILLLSSCAISNEGAIDFRRAQFLSKEDLAKASAGGKDPVAPTKLFRKDLLASDPNALIEKLDKVSIRLRDGFLKDCNEWPNPLRKFRKNCEIAILFKAFELGAGADFKFQPGAERDARLVYFSPDVEPGQHFNLHNMPVYGPIEYKGRPLGLDIKIIEIDAEDKQAFAIFKTIAAIGAQAYAPAAPVLGVLEAIGSSLVNSGTDDTEWRYTMVLDPSGGFSGNIYGTLEAGDYVFVREENRQARTPWEELQYDHNTGRLWKGNEPYTENTYLTVQILKDAGSEDVTLDQNTYGPFRDALDRDISAKVEQMQSNLMPQLEKLAASRVRAKNFNQAQHLYEGLLVDLKSKNTIGAANKAFELCQAMSGASTVLSDKDPKVQDRSNLDLEQLEYLFRRLRINAGISTPAEIAQYTPSGFAKDGKPVVTLDQCTSRLTTEKAVK